MKKYYIQTTPWAVLALIILMAAAAFPAHAQQPEPDQPAIQLKQGSVLTGFSGGWASSLRDDHNQDFERGIRRVVLNLDALYFISSRFAIGPEISYGYLRQDFEDPFETGETASQDRWEWLGIYGGEMGWFVPTQNLFGSSVLRQSVFFTKAGVNWQRRQTRSEGFEKNDPQIRFGYTVSTGLLIPVGKRIGLETSLRYEARRTEYGRYGGSFPNPVLIREDVKWPSTISLGVGLKIQL